VKVAVIGRGNLGGGLARLWRAAGHEVVEIGRDGGDAGGAEAILLAVPSAAIGDALGSVTGIGDIPVIDATNLVRGDRPEGYDSLAGYVKSLTGGPVAKAFNTNFARLYDRLGEARARPTTLYAADDDAREVTERLIADAGYEPASMGGLDQARALEDFLRVIFAVSQERGGQVLYRFAPPDEL
jgi:8-hydroxy-5-deazaflavin:NADPH oxidoreductase